MKILRQPVMMCYACGTVFEFEKEDILTSKQEKMIVACPNCNYLTVLRQQHKIYIGEN